MPVKMLPPSSTSVAPLLRLVFAIGLLAAVIFNKLATHDDPHRCRALLHDGSWLDQPDENGSRKPFTNWQPDGCMLRQYTPADMHKCLGGRDVVISGDSTMRQIFWAFARMLDRDKAVDGEAHKIPHHDDEATSGDIHLLQYWNPYLETDSNQANHEFEINPGLASKLGLFHHETHNDIPAVERHGPAFMILSAGPWFALTQSNEDSLANFKFAMNKLTGTLNLENTTDFGTQPMHPADGLGPDVFFAPIATPFYDQLPDRKTSGNGIKPGEIEAINDFIYEIEEERNLRLAKAFPKLTLNQPEAIVDLHDTGFHVIDSVAEIKATILLNLRCNAVLDAQDGFPYDRTCCTDYGRPTFVQKAILAVITFYVLACVAVELLSFHPAFTKPQSLVLDMEFGIFGAALLLCYFADRTQLFAKGNKEFVLSDLWTLVAIGAVIALISIRKVQLRQSMKVASAALTDYAPADIGVLSRDQTDEWKGWSQVVILVYHWTDATDHVPTYILVRLLIASYLFQIGYSHTVYFLEKKDFSFRRVAAVVLRLNLLNFTLPYVMNTSYMFYYFAPLMSFWFLVVYAALAWRSNHNDDTRQVLGKIGLFCFLGLLLQYVPIWYWVFSILGIVFNIHWNLRNWVFNVNLDGFIVFVGMLAGVAYHRLERNKTWFTNYNTFIIPAIITVAIYGYYTSSADLSVKPYYNRLHPYISFLPIISFILLRNATAPLRNRFSVAAAWLGRCSLETYILHYHIFLAADTKGVLLLDIFRGGDGTLSSDRWRDLAIIVPIFLWLSHSVSEATSAIVKVVTASREIDTSLEDDEVPVDLESYSLVGNSEEEGKGIEVARTSGFMNLPGYGLQAYSIALLGGMWVLNWLY